MRVEEAPSYPVSIFIAGNIELARMACAKFCDKVGLCVTVTPTTYVYTGGEEHGVIVGLINYPRFPTDPDLIEDSAIRLGDVLREALGQESFSVQTPNTTMWFSWRSEDHAIAAATGTAKTAKPVECGAPQSGAESASPNPRRIA